MSGKVNSAPPFLANGGLKCPEEWVLPAAGWAQPSADYGRFGVFVQQGAVIDGEHVVPDGWFREAGSAHVIGGKSVAYGYFWWPLPAGDPVHQGAFQASGIFGQHLYINPNERLVIVVLSARPKPDSESHVLSDEAFFAAVAKSLQ